MTPDMILRSLLLGILLPAGASIVILLIFRATHFAAAPAVALSYLLADWAVAPKRPLLPNEAWQWLGPVALAALVISLFSARARNSSRPRTLIVILLMRAALLGAAVWLMLAPLREYEWEGPAAYLRPAATCLVLLLAWSALDGWMHALADRQQFLWLLVFLAFSSALLVLAGSKRLGDLGGALMAAVAACALVSLWRPAAPLAAGARAVACAVLCGLIVNGWYFAEMPPASLALVGAGLVAPLVMRLGALRRLSGPRAILLRGILLVVPLGLALTLAARAYFADSGEYGY